MIGVPLEYMRRNFLVKLNHKVGEALRQVWHMVLQVPRLRNEQECKPPYAGLLRPASCDWKHKQCPGTRVYPADGALVTLSILNRRISSRSTNRRQTHFGGGRGRFDTRAKKIGISGLDVEAKSVCELSGTLKNE